MRDGVARLYSQFAGGLDGRSGRTRVLCTCPAGLQDAPWSVDRHAVHFAWITLGTYYLSSEQIDLDSLNNRTACQEKPAG
jgi:hypothetical protein